MALADLMIYTENVYGSEEGNKVIDKVFETIAVTAWETSIEIAKEKGSFGFLIGETEEETMELRKKFATTGYIGARMPDHVKEGIIEHGVRNVSLTTVAPTGSTGSMMNVSTGLEPYFAFKYFRSGRLGKFIEVNADIVQEYLDANPEADADNLPDFFVSAMDLTPEQHASVQNTIQYWVDASISKTVNMPAGSTPEDVGSIYQQLYEGGSKGGTVFVDGSRDTQVLTLTNEDNNLNEQIVDSGRIGIEDLNVEGIIAGNFDNGQVTIEGDNVIYTPEVDVEEAKRKDYLATLEIGIDAGDLCPVCQDGEVVERGGCTECSNMKCRVQLKCD